MRRKDSRNGLGSGIKALAICAVLASSPVFAGEDDGFDPDRVSEVDAINCRLDAPTYNGFALSIAGDGKIAERRHWTKLNSANPFMNEYELPQPITIAGRFSTRRIGLTADSIVAILDQRDPAVVARPEKIANALDSDALVDALAATGKATRAQAEAEIRFRKFLGQRVVSEVRRPATDNDGLGTHTIITRTISNATTHPGKTFYGCLYRIEVLDSNGKPL